MAMGPSRKPVDTRLWSQVDKGDEEWHCWEWTGTTNDKGYGRFNFFDGSRAATHRLAYRLDCKHPPEPEVVMHICNNPSCVNPLHLKGTDHNGNVQHRVRCGRSHRPFGNKHGEKSWSKRRGEGE